MSRFDNFLDMILGSLIVDLLVFSGVVCFYLSKYCPLGYLGPLLLFAAGAGVSAAICYYYFKGRNKSQG